WNGSGRQKSFPGHSEVALLIVGWNAAFVSKRDASQVPRQMMGHRRKPRINRPRSVPSRKRNTELVAFANSLVRLLKNEVRGVTGEILRSNDVRLSFHRQNTLFSRGSARDTQLIHSPLPFEGRGFGERSHYELESPSPQSSPLRKGTGGVVQTAENDKHQ